MDLQATPQKAVDADAIRAIHQRMIDAWNAGDAVAFATPFTDAADFVAFEGTHLTKRPPGDRLGDFHEWPEIWRRSGHA